MTLSVSPYYDYSFFETDLSKSSINSHKRGLEAFLSFLPIKACTISLGEGNTPLTPAHNLSKKYHNQIYVKHEELNPTGSFKDRETAISINYVLENHPDIKHVTIASSGNAAVSAAAYAQVAGLQCTSYVPAETSESKKELIQLFGASCQEIDGNYEEVYRYLADHPVEDAVNITAGIDHVRVEGNKTVAYEMYEAGVIPDYVVVPCGNGGNLAGIWKGFEDLFQKKLISTVPKMIAVQIAKAAPLAEAIKQKQAFFIVKDIPDSIAEGIIAEESYCSPKALQAITQSHGQVIEVTDQQIIDVARVVMKGESLVLEPTSYAAFAAVEQLSKNITNQSIAVIATGSGLKMLEEVQDLLSNHS